MKTKDKEKSCFDTSPELWETRGTWGKAGWRGGEEEARPVFRYPFFHSLFWNIYTQVKVGDTNQVIMGACRPIVCFVVGNTRDIHAEFKWSTPTHHLCSPQGLLPPVTQTAQWKRSLTHTSLQHMSFSMDEKACMFPHVLMHVHVYSMYVCINIHRHIFTHTLVNTEYTYVGKHIHTYIHTYTVSIHTHSHTHTLLWAGDNCLAAWSIIQVPK